MKIVWVPATVAGSGPEHFQYSTSVIINECVAIDAGSLGYYRTAQDQSKIKHIFISHTHIDHVATLPIFVENAYEGSKDCVTIYGSDSVMESCQIDLFNDRIWPDFIKLSENSEAPFLKLHPFNPGESLEVDGLRIRSVLVDHVVPTSAFIVEDDQSAVIFVSDTGPTEEIWKVAAEVENLKAVFLEVTFPNELKWLAEVSKHLTPKMFEEETKKLDRPVRWFVVHMKARFQTKVMEELKALNVEGLELPHFGAPYTF